MKHWQFYLVSLLWGIFAFSQELPPIQKFSPQLYEAGNQNWMIAQAPDASIYIANNNGLLKYNGSRWQLYPSPNNTIVRAVKAIDDKIYTGSFMDFGCWNQNSEGQLIYTSLAESLNIDLIEDEQFWNILEYDNWLLFQSLNRLIFVNPTTKEVKFIKATSTYSKSFKRNGNIYFHEQQRGLYMLKSGKPSLVSSHPIFRNHIIVNIFNVGQKFLIVTDNAGLYFLEKGKLTRWKTDADSLFQQTSIYSAIQLLDQNLLIGTISKGLLKLNPQGEIDLELNQSKGISNNTVLSVFEDKTQNVWLGLDNGINCLNLTSPFSIYNETNGSIGSVYTSITHNGNLYLGTNQGLFSKRISSKAPFSLVPGTAGQVWNLTKLNGDLLCGHDLGTFKIEGNKAIRFSTTQGAWDFKPLNKNKTLALQGNYSGLYVIQKKGRDWSVRNKIEGFNISSKFFELVNDTTLLISHEYKGVYKVVLDSDYTKAIEIVEEQSVKKSSHSCLISFEGYIIYKSNDGVFLYNKDKQTFDKDALINNFFPKEEYTSGKMINDRAGKLWMFSKNYFHYLTSDILSSTLKVKSLPFPYRLSRGMEGYEHVLSLSNNKFLYGTMDGYVTFDLKAYLSKSPPVNLDKISLQSLDGKETLLPLNTSIDLEPNQNNISFYYNVPYYQKAHQVKFQYKLIGYYDQWSSWSENSFTTFTNLPFGDYTLSVRAKIGDVTTETKDFMQVSIEKAWYLSNLMVIIYVLFFIFISLSINQSYTRYYRKQQQKLIEKNNRILEIKELENNQELMKFKNEQLQKDIENKNRELAISTMSTIRRNKFLGSIKDSLKDEENSPKVRAVIRTIDRNLNNDDDWKFFEEAFNNADKDFLKKVKQIHPSLTHNDLRLCAYLRLNLSSKEIAPLLNISSRSVEIKRYRLRKKMELEHKQSLVDYIMTL
ncbi:MAG: triple tyrosine motif-containing protein [Flavobacteriaceae bacterium]|nr:triple tyrosine motif-containing protein [Flavobacteriaceae bacterium]MDG2313985.1 triple tyrosine motif-containing protein [Flavobacteriaceae bacterium]